MFGAIVSIDFVFCVIFVSFFRTEAEESNDDDDYDDDVENDSNAFWENAS